MSRYLTEDQDPIQSFNQKSEFKLSNQKSRFVHQNLHSIQLFNKNLEFSTVSLTKKKSISNQVIRKEIKIDPVLKN